VRRYVFKKKWKSIAVYLIDLFGGIVFFGLRFRKQNAEPTSFLVARLDQVGDVIQVLPFFEALRKKYPNSKITALCAKPSEFLLYNSPSVDNVIVMENSWFYDEKVKFRELVKVSRAIRATKPDLGFDLRGDFRNIVFLFLSGVRRVYGYGSTGGGFLLSKEFEFRNDEHQLDKNLRLLGEKSQPLVSINFPASQNAQDEIIPFLDAAPQGRKIVVHPFTRAESKMWGIEKYATLIEQIREFSTAAIIFVIGSANESKLVKDFPWGTRLIDCTGKLSFAGTLALMRKSDFFIGNDSAPQYLAAYSGKKTCVIYGDTVNYRCWKPKVQEDHLITFSKEVYCGPCESSVCLNKKEGHLCMDIITVDEVFQAVKKWL
jgi:lipopolysaccharide heptosyltransferase II